MLRTVRVIIWSSRPQSSTLPSRICVPPRKSGSASSCSAFSAACNSSSVDGESCCGRPPDRPSVPPPRPPPAPLLYSPEQWSKRLVLVGDLHGLDEELGQRHAEQVRRGMAWNSAHTKEMMQPCALFTCALHLHAISLVVRTVDVRPVPRP